MLFKKQFWEGLRGGRITVAYRRWRRPSVKVGGTLRTPVGTLSIRSVERVSQARLSAEEAVRAGFESLAALKQTLADRPGDLYRIEFRYAEEDDRIALRQDVDAAALDAVAEKLAGMDRRSGRGAWTGRFLRLIRDQPGTRAPDLAQAEGLETVVFKRDVRKLKALGLTESLRVGYRLSPRGEAYLKRTG